MGLPLWNSPTHPVPQQDTESDPATVAGVVEDCGEEAAPGMGDIGMDLGVNFLDLTLSSDDHSTNRA